MSVTEMIQELQRIHDEFGDLQVEVRNEAGDWDSAASVQTEERRKPVSEPRLFVHIDV